MNASQTKKRKYTLGERDFLQGPWSMAVNHRCDHSDRRLSVLNGECVTTTTFNRSARETGKPHHDDPARHDGLLGSLLIESLFTTIFGGILPLWTQGIDWTGIVESTDEMWLERRTARSGRQLPPELAYARTTYFPL